MQQDPHAPPDSAEDAGSSPPPSLRKTGLRLLLRAALAVLILPVAMVLTLALSPLWSWLERTTGIESMGHQGPASWCYLAVWGLLAAAVVAPALWRAIRGVCNRSGNGA